LIRTATGLRTDDPNDTIKVKALRAEMEAKEFRRTPDINNDSWDTWVDKFFIRHCKCERTLQRYQGNWKWISLLEDFKRLLNEMVKVSDELPSWNDSPGTM